MNNREFFNNVAQRWDEMCKHDISKLRKIIELSEVAEGSSILDVGTGTGILISHLLVTSPAKITAVDIAENMIEVAKSKYTDDRIEFAVSDIMEFDKCGYDYIFLYSVYPHFNDKAAVLSHLSSLLNIGGKLIIAHSQSRDKINEIHGKSENVKEHVLAPASITAELMRESLEIQTVIDDMEMYYVSGIKGAVG